METKKELLIPKIIHQIWSGIDQPLPKLFQTLGATWKRDYPEWNYMLWDHNKMNTFIQEYYPLYWDSYNNFPYNIQRWDAIRYLILDQFGGMYVDFDYESIRPMEAILEGKTCCFSAEPETHRGHFGYTEIPCFNNALMLSIPGHPFMRKVIKSVFSDNGESYNIHSFDYVLRTTGPWKLMTLYNELNEHDKKQVYLLPKEYVTPFDVNQTRRFMVNKERSKELEDCLKDAYAIHYFFNTWSKEIK